MPITALAATTLALSVFCNDVGRDFPTSRSNAPLHFQETGVLREPFTYENHEEVISYIKNKPNVYNLYKSLPVLIESVFGDVKVKLSIFRDAEEDWDNLWVEIESDYEIEKLIALEYKLFEEIEKDASFIAALKYVTISCG